MPRWFLQVVLLIGCQVGFALATLRWLPGHVATQFGLDGIPVGWMTPRTHVLFIFFLTAFLSFTFFGVAQWILRFQSLKFVNIPWKRYWMENPRQMSEGLKRTALFMQVGGWGSNGLVFGGQLLILQQNGMPIPFPFSINGFIVTVIMLITGYYLWMFSLFKPPRK